MKKLSIYIMALLSMGFVACDNGDYAPEVGPQSNPQEEIVPAYQLNVTPAAESFNIPEITDETVQLFTPAEGVSAEGYTVVLQYGDNTTEIEADANGYVNAKDLNNALIRVAGVQAAATEYTMCVKSLITTAVAGETTQLNATSTPIKFTAIQKAPLVDYVFDTTPVLYFTGNNYGWGSQWNALVPVHSHDNLSWLIVYLHEGEEFKFAPQQGWGDDFGAVTVNDNAGSGIVGESSGTANLKVVKAGWYLVSVDKTTKTVTIDTPNIYLFGDAAGGWDYNDAMIFSIPTSEDGEFVSPEFLSDAEVRMAVKVAGADWWQTEFVAKADGTVDFRGAGDDQARVKVSKGQRLHLTLGTAQGYGSYK